MYLNEPKLCSGTATSGIEPYYRTGQLLAHDVKQKDTLQIEA